MEQSEPLEADLAHAYPRDGDQLTDFYAGRMSLRRLWVLVSGLPHGSHTARELHGEIADWTMETYLYARTVNALLTANGQRAGKRIPLSEYVQAPRDKAQDRQVKSRAMSMAKITKKQRPEPAGDWQALDKMFNA